MKKNCQAIFAKTDDYQNLDLWAFDILQFHTKSRKSTHLRPRVNYGSASGWAEQKWITDD